MEKFREIQEVIDRILNIPKENIISISHLGGLTNENYLVKTCDDSYVIRFPGKGTNEIIERKSECICINLANELGLDPSLVYFDIVTGIKISYYIQNSEPMTSEMLRLNTEDMQLVAGLLQKLHNCKKNIPVNFNVSEIIIKYENLLKKMNFTFPTDYFYVKNKIFSLRKLQEALKFEMVPCHNDPMPENFLKCTSTNKLYLIDWEYGGMNDPMWDLAALALECGFKEEDEKKFIRIYTDYRDNKTLTFRFLINKIYVDFVWGIWGILRSKSGDANPQIDFEEYGKTRYEKAKINIKKFEKRFKINL